MKANTILLIEDDIDDQDIFCEALKEVDPTIVVHRAMNGRDAIKQLQQQRFVPDLIMVDLNMPIVNGFEFLQAFPKHFPDSTIPIIVYTTTDGMGDRLKAKQLGAYHFIPKPATYPGVVDILRGLLV
jgi:CheY-like chemotaxis protein